MVEITTTGYGIAPAVFYGYELCYNGFMHLTIPDDVLEQAGLTERDALIEFACRLFDADKLSLPAASKLAGMGRDEFQGELHARKIAVFRPTIQDFRDDVETLKKINRTAK